MVVRLTTAYNGFLSGVRTTQYSFRNSHTLLASHPVSQGDISMEIKDQSPNGRVKDPMVDKRGVNSG
jgi:hypothetical protein